MIGISLTVLCSKEHIVCAICVVQWYGYPKILNKHSLLSYGNYSYPEILFKHFI